MENINKLSQKIEKLVKESKDGTYEKDSQIDKLLADIVNLSNGNSAKSYEQIEKELGAL